ncbi:endonuclease/exonuclease/phosphatase family protein [Echinicola sp. CAU 1574]|uniref:Endonuclease/exonuclease/phosphatase family protein n=1 Tax=Echinicola arenosa TaxID=2774144 RepID=A0ABR9ANC7_9BACT|nr:endonuclease/exonuclease/phosphatase family protein [Echinicola arenosa]MBD8490302.1 endonuclease/exonuclease/phosphatase family protein [Echinicola arenosa]
MKTVKTLLTLIITLTLTLISKAQNTEFTILTYNIYHGEQAYQKGKPNLDDIAKLIKDIDPDFVALQEVDSMTQRTAEVYDGKAVDLVNKLASKTGMHGFFAKAIDYSGGGYGEGLLSKNPAELSKIDLPIPQGGEGRAMAIASYKLKNEQTITFGATHLCHQFDSNRIAQTEAIVEHLEKKIGPSIVAGDLNFKPETTPYKILEKGYIDAAASYGNPLPTIPYENPRSRIDYVWLSKNSNWEITEVKVIPVGFSDHMPVLVKVVLKD